MLGDIRNLSYYRCIFNGIGVAAWWGELMVGAGGAGGGLDEEQKKSGPTEEKGERSCSCTLVSYKNEAT